MSEKNSIPEKVVNYNVYSDGNKIIGLAGEVTLPNLEFMTETISGAGIMGEYDSPTPGHTGSLSIELTWRTIYDKSAKLQDPKGTTLVLRASQQHYDPASGQTFRPLKITMKGIPKGHDLGKISVGGPTDTKQTFEVMYLKIEENDEVLLELDKINFVYIVNGVDVLKNIKSQI